MALLKLFLQKPKNPAKESFLAKLLTSDSEFEGGLFQQIPALPFRSMVQFVDTLEEADYIFSPINYSAFQRYPEELQILKEVSNKSSIPLLIFNYGDLNEPIRIENSIVLKPAGYKSEILKHEVTIPAFVEDLGEKYGVSIRKKSENKPIVGFSGMIKTPNIFQECKYQLRIYEHWLRVLFLKANPASYQGLFFRRKVTKSLLKDSHIDSQFNIRKTFSGNVKTVEKNPADLRKEFVYSIKDSDLALVVRGDGNYSLRFFEVLSLGRIPLFIDTDSPLPLEEEINFDSFMLRVDYRQIKQLPEIVRNWWENISPEEYKEMQIRARHAFETQLRADVFYKNFFIN